jgi:hypothetical protein
MDAYVRWQRWPSKSLRTAVKTLEEAFWRGYGAISVDLAAALDAISTARLFYFLLPRLLHRGKRRGWVAGAEASFYIRWLEPLMIKRALQHLGWSAGSYLPASSVAGTQQQL